MLFESSELDSTPPEMLQQKASEIKQRFDMRRNVYHHNRNTLLLDRERWVKFDREIQAFEIQFNSWNNQWGQFYQSNDINIYKQYFLNGNTVYEKIEKFLQDTPIVTSIDANALEIFRQNFQNTMEKRFVDITNQFSVQVSEGINSLVRLKGELGLTKDFGDKIKDQVVGAKLGNWIFFSLFLISLILYGVTITVPFFYSPFKDFAYWEQWGLRLSFSIPIGLIIFFIYNQYRFYKLSYTKYQHLEIFLGGGITSLHSLLEANSTLKDDASKKIADLFINIDDILKPISSKNSPYPIDIKDLNQTISELTKNMDSIAKLAKNSGP